MSQVDLETNDLMDHVKKKRDLIRMQKRRSFALYLVGSLFWGLMIGLISLAIFDDLLSLSLSQVLIALIFVTIFGVMMDN